MIKTSSIQGGFALQIHRSRRWHVTHLRRRAAARDHSNIFSVDNCQLAFRHHLPHADSKCWSRFSGGRSPVIYLFLRKFTYSVCLGLDQSIYWPKFCIISDSWTITSEDFDWLIILVVITGMSSGLGLGKRSGSGLLSSSGGSGRPILSGSVNGEVVGNMSSSPSSARLNDREFDFVEKCSRNRYARVNSAFLFWGLSIVYSLLIQLLIKCIAPCL